MVNAESQPTEWFYKLLGLPTGPVSAERIEWLLGQQHLVAETLVAKSASGPWLRLDDSDLRHLLPACQPTADAKPAVASASADGIPQKKPRRSGVSIGAVSVGIEIDTEALAESEPSHAAAVGPAAPVAESADAPSPPPTSQQRRAEENSDFDAQPTELTLTGTVEPAAETEIGSSTEPEFAISLDEPNGPQAATTPTVPKAERTATQADAARGLKKAKKSKANQGASTAQNRPDLTRLLKSLRQRPVAAISSALAATLVLAFALGVFSASADTEGAAATFDRVMSQFDTNSELSDIEWAKWCEASRAEVSAVLEPLREHASADQPDVQNLMWAGDQLTLLLKGVRNVPPSVRTRFEAYMADYRGEPPPPPTATGPGDQTRQQVIDPIF